MLEENNKYYAPEIEEFYVGFEFKKVLKQLGILNDK